MLNKAINEAKKFVKSLDKKSVAVGAVITFLAMVALNRG